MSHQSKNKMLQFEGHTRELDAPPCTLCTPLYSQNAGWYSIILQRFLLGGLAIAVPGEVHGLRRAWREYHQLPWETLVQPAIDLARDGFPISTAVAEVLSEKDMVMKVKNDSGLR